MEITGGRLAAPPQHQEAQIHLTHSLQSHHTSRARQSPAGIRPTPSGGRSMWPLPGEGRDTHIDSPSVGTNPLSLETQLPGFTTQSRMVEIFVSTTRVAWPFQSLIPNPSTRHSRNMNGLSPRIRSVTEFSQLERGPLPRGPEHYLEQEAPPPSRAPTPRQTL